MPASHDSSEVPALIALFAGALAIGSSGIFVRLSETGPTATAFWRGLLALPLLAVWALLERRSRAGAGQHAAADMARSWRDPMFFWAGVFFAGDLALWHASLLLTSVAASTLEANCAPMVVTLGAWALWGERPRLSFLLALGLASGGLLLIVGTKLGHGTAALTGDLLGLGTACFYGFYILAVARLRTRHGTGIVMFNSTLVFTVLLLPLALPQKFLPDTPRGWLLLGGCALSAQVLGQGMVAYALARLPATFSAVGLYVQAIAAALYAWLLLNERLTPWQIVGGFIVLGAIALARTARRAPLPDSQPSPASQLQRESIQSSAPRHSESR
ncbi:MAG TPA: DMT family transporter [Steroidobacteraceae bacterium]